MGSLLGGNCKEYVLCQIQGLENM